MPNSLNQEIISITEYPTRGRNSDDKHTVVKQTGTDMVIADPGYLSAAENAMGDPNVLARKILDTGGEPLSSKYVFATKDVKHDKGIYAGLGVATYNARIERWMTIS